MVAGGILGSLIFDIDAGLVRLLVVIVPWYRLVIIECSRIARVRSVPYARGDVGERIQDKYCPGHGNK